jgi:hypothetical protein
VIAFRHADPRLPFLHEHTSQSPARWHDAGEGPVNYFSDTPDGAWAEFLRHEEIRDPEDLATVRRALWAVDIGEEASATPALPGAVLVGGAESHARCRAEARRLRALGATRIDAPAAALVPGGASGHRVDGGLRPGPPRDGRTIALFGRRPALVGWRAAQDGRPGQDLLARVRHTPRVE